MIELNRWTTIAVLNWLAVILVERFGYKWNLTFSQDKLILQLKASEDCVIFDTLNGCFSASHSDLPCTHWDAEAEGWQSVLEDPLPAPGANELPSPLIEKQDKNYVIHYDILGLTYWMLTRQEEIGRTDLDKRGRFPATASHAYKHGYLERPIVDEWLHILGQVLQRTWPQLKLKQHQFSMKVSHDVDSPSYYAFKSWSTIARICTGHILKRFSPRQAIQAPIIKLNSQHRLHSSDPANTFNWIMDTSEEYGLTSAFYFICGRSEVSKDADYEIEHPAIRTLMRQIHERGHEIGLHPSYNAYQTPEIIINEAKRLKAVCEQEGIQQEYWGGRMHYLRWEHPTTLYGWEQAGMAYDSTLGYADHAGFRCGTCFEYPMFDPCSQRLSNLRIRPLIAMECSVINYEYMNLGLGQKALEKLLDLKYKCKIIKGNFTLLWHNSDLTSENSKTLYKSILEPYTS